MKTLKKLSLLMGFMTASFVGMSQQLNVNVQITDISTYENGTGTLTAEVTGGVAPYYILWSNGSTKNTIQNVSKKNYMIRVSDSLGNTVEELIILKPNNSETSK